MLIDVCAGKGRGRVGELGDVVDADVVELRQPDDEGEGDLALALLVVGVGGFVHAKHGNQLILCQVVVFAKIAEAAVVQIPVPLPANDVLTKYHKCCIMCVEIHQMM